MKFRKTYIEITNTCNLSCTFCPKTSRKPLFMGGVMFDSLCAQLRGRSERLYLHVMGEPLLHPNLPHYFDICETYGHRVHLVTNGLLLADVVDVLVSKPALRQLSISLHSLTVRMNPEALHSYFRTIKRAADAFKGSSRIVQLRLWNKGACDPAVQSMALGLIRETFGLLPLFEEKPDALRSFMLGKNLYVDSTPPFEWPSLDNKDYGGSGTCLGIRRQCAVLADGTVTACCLDNDGTINLGNVRERPLVDILNDERAVAIRKGFEQGTVVEELCRKCSYRLRFSPETAFSRASLR